MMASYLSVVLRQYEMKCLVYDAVHALAHLYCLSLAEEAIAPSPRIRAWLSNFNIAVRNMRPRFGV